MKNNKTFFTKKTFKKLFTIGLIAAITTTAAVEIANSYNNYKNISSLSNKDNLNSVVNNQEQKINSMINAFVLSKQPVSNFVVANTNANNTINKFIENSKINPNSSDFKQGFSTQINKMMNNPAYLKQLLHSSNLTSSQYAQIKSLLNNLNNKYGSNSVSNYSSLYKKVNTNLFKNLNSSISNLFSDNDKYQIKVILNSAVGDLSSLAGQLNEERSGLAASAGAVAAVLGILAFLDGGTTAIVAVVVGTVLGIILGSFAGVLNTLAWSMSGLEGKINDSSSLLAYSNTLSQVEQTISSCSNAIQSAVSKLSGYKWVVGINNTISELTTSRINLSNCNYRISKSINLLAQVATNNNSNLNITTYIENAVLNWMTSNQNATNTPNSSFTNLIQQSMFGYKILNNSQDFSNFKVSFTKMSSNDNGALGNKYWLTLKATATKTINFTNWNSYAWCWNSNTVKTAQAGSVFTWVLPYSISDVSLVNNQVSLQVDSTFTNWYSGSDANYNLAVPFGLSIGNSSNPTAISSTWSGNVGGVIASNYGSYSVSYNLPSNWTFAFSTQNDVANVFDAQINENTSNLGNSNESSTTFLNNIVRKWMVGFNLQANAQDFTSWHVGWSQNLINGYKVLELSAYSNVGIQPLYWNQNANYGAGAGEKMNYTIPAGSYFTWTLPYYWNGINSAGATISLNQILGSDYVNADDGLSLWNTPLGLSIGSSSNNPTSISSNTWFTHAYSNDSSSTTSKNGVIAIGYGTNCNDSTPNLSFNTTWNNSSSNQQPVVATVNENLNANININAILNDEGITTLVGYINQYQSPNFKQLLLNDFLGSNNLTVTNLSYSLTSINGITVRNNSSENINVILDGNLITTLLPHQIKNVNLDINLINANTFISYETNLNLTQLLNENNAGAVSYYHTMGAYNESDAYDVAAVYGLLTTNINSLGQYNGYDFSHYGSNYAKTITSSTWNAYYNPRQLNQTIQLSWVAEMLGFSSNGFDGYQIYAQNGSDIVINKVDYNNVWYNVNYNINLGSRFSLYWNFFIFTW